MSFSIKKMSVGAWISAVAALLSLVSVIVYGVNVSSAGYFQNASVSNLVLFVILTIVMLVAVVILAQLNVTGGAATGVELVSGAMQILAPVLLAFCLVNLVSARAQGLGFIFFSNADVILEVQTPENMASATGTIVNMVCLAVAMIASVIGAFCSTKKKA